ncbi:hypothetical protein OG533_39430 (plasmid) [Streptomyces sp. NBC_01186]|uniref:hypothetical protein n=1 Tax=unclassified Streptomyces TaxID=2593676 RepID=UPI002DDBFDC6|nr:MULTISPECIES: hypothetical protein [unclassified Streptomyces]WSB81983.1 hypothetical protein OHB04_40320 [Streptomyces sp. NBC_01775]WSS17958.1 hypothetical protein OG533_39430 [Streptomyces sp. NBC_01186]
MPEPNALPFFAQLRDQLARVALPLSAEEWRLNPGGGLLSQGPLATGAEAERVPDATWTHTDFQIYDRHALIASLPVPHSPTDVDSPKEAAEAVTDSRAAVAALVAAPDALKTLLDAGLPELLHAAAQWDRANHATDHDRETAAVQLARRLARFGEALG